MANVNNALHIEDDEFYEQITMVVRNTIQNQVPS